MKREQCHTRGFSTVEALLAAVLFAVIAGAFAIGAFEGIDGVITSSARQRALMLADEGLEAVRNIRDSSFSLLTVGTHGLGILGSQWIFSGSSDTTDIFTRTVDIATVDSDRKQVTSTVTWQQNPQRTGEVELTTYLTNWLASAGQSGKCISPYERATTDMSGPENGVKVQIQGTYAYLVRADGTPDFAIFDVSDPNSPSMIGSLSLSGVPTNIFVSGSYAYVSSQSDTSELQIISIAAPSSPTVVGTFNAAGSANANGIFVNGITAVLVRATSGSDEFITIDVALPSSPAFLGSLDLGGTGYEVSVLGNYAYVASGHNSQELQVVDMANPSAPVVIGSYNASGNTDSTTVIAQGNHVYLGRANILLSIDVSTPSLPTFADDINVIGSVFDIALTVGGGTALYLGTDTAHGEFKVVDVSVPTALVVLCSLDVTGNNPLLGISYDSATDTVFAAGSSDTGELVIIAPQ